MKSITTGNKGKILDPIDDRLLGEIMTFIKNNPDELLHIPSIAIWMAIMRIDVLKEGDISFHDGGDGENLIENTVQHNLKGLLTKSTMFRPRLLASILWTIPQIHERIKDLKVLCVGPRTEVEIFMLTSAGFDPANIRGLDLISYSSLVDVGDMHDLPYEDDSFDIVIFGWVFAYSKNPMLAAREARRVAKSDGVFAVGCEYTPYSAGELQAKGSDLAEDAGRYKNVSEIWDLFEGDVGDVWYQHSIHPSVQDKPGSVMTVFQRKLDA